MIEATQIWKGAVLSLNIKNVASKKIFPSKVTESLPAPLSDKNVYGPLWGDLDPTDGPRRPSPPGYSLVK